jgi:Tetratricopeptide repeat
MRAKTRSHHASHSHCKRLDARASISNPSFMRFACFHVGICAQAGRSRRTASAPIFRRPRVRATSHGSTIRWYTAAMTMLSRLRAYLQANTEKKHTLLASIAEAVGEADRLSFLELEHGVRATIAIADVPLMIAFAEAIFVYNTNEPIEQGAMAIASREGELSAESSEVRSLGVEKENEAPKSRRKKGSKARAAAAASPASTRDGKSSTGEGSTRHRETFWQVGLLAAEALEQTFYRDAEALRVLEAIAARAATSQATVAKERAETIRARREKGRTLLSRYIEEASVATSSELRCQLLVAAAETAFRLASAPSEGTSIDASSGAGTKDAPLSWATSHRHLLAEALAIDPLSSRARALAAKTHQNPEMRLEYAEAYHALLRTARASADVETSLAYRASLMRLVHWRLARGERQQVAWLLAECIEIGQSLTRLGLAEDVLTSVLSEFGLWRGLAEVYQASLTERTEQSLEERQGTLLQLGMILWRYVDPALARMPLAELRQLRPDHPVALDYLRYEAREELGAALRLIAAAQPDAGAELMLIEASDVTTFRAKCQEAWQAERPAETWAFEGLRALTTEPSSRGEVLRQQLALLPESDFRRVFILRELATLYRTTLRSETQLASTLSLLALKLPHDVALIEELARVQKTMGRVRDWVATEERLGALEHDPARALPRYRKAAELLQENNQATQALQVLEKMFERAPEDHATALALLEAAKKRRAFRALLGMQGRLYVWQSDPAVRLACKRELVLLAQEQREFTKDVLAQGFSQAEFLDTTLRDGIEKLAERENDVETIVISLRARLHIAPDSLAREQSLLRLAAVYHDAGRTDLELATFRELVAVNPNQPRALRALRDSATASGAISDIEALFRHDQDGLVNALMMAFDRTDELAKKTEYAIRLLGISEREMQGATNERSPAGERYVRSLERVLALTPNRFDLRGKLAGAFHRAGEREKEIAVLAQTYRRHIADNSPEDARTVARVLVDTLENAVKRPREALAYRIYLFQSSPNTDAEAELVALLSATLQSSADKTDQALILAAVEERTNRQVDARATKEEQGAATRQGLAFRLLALREFADRDPASAEAFQATLWSFYETDPDAAASELEASLRARGNPDELRRFFEQDLARRNTAARIDGLLDWAAMEEDAFGDGERALRLYERVLEQIPKHGAATRAIVRLAPKTGRADLAETILRGEANNFANARAIADLRLTHFSDPIGALRAAKDATTAEDVDPPALRALFERLLTFAETRADAARTLSELYLAEGRQDKRAEVLGILQPMLAAKEDRAEVALARAEACLAAGDATTAKAALASAVLECPRELSFWRRLKSLCDGLPSGAYVSFCESALAPDKRAAQASEVVLYLVDELSELLRDAPSRCLPYLLEIFERDDRNESVFLRLRETLLATQGASSPQLVECTCRFAEKNLNGIAIADARAEGALRFGSLEDWTASPELLGSDLGSRIGEFVRTTLERFPEVPQAWLLTQRYLLGVGDAASWAAWAESRLGFTLGDRIVDDWQRVRLAWAPEPKSLERASDEEAPASRANPHELEPAFLRSRLVAYYLSVTSGSGSSMAPEQHALFARRLVYHARNVLRVAPHDRDVRLSLEKQLAVPSVRHAAARGLREVYEVRGEQRQIAQMNVVLLEVEDASKPGYWQLLRSLADLYELELSEDAEALPLLEKLARNPSEPAIYRERYLEVARRLNAFGPASVMLLSVSQTFSEEDSSATLSLLFDYFRTDAAKGVPFTPSDVQSFQTVCERAIVLPNCAVRQAAADVLLSTFQAQGNMAEELRVLRAVAGSADGPEEEERSVRMAQLLGELEDSGSSSVQPGEGILLLERLFDEGSIHDDLLAQLQRHYRRNENRARAILVLARQIEVAPPDVQLELRSEYAALLEADGRRDDAVVEYQNLLDAYGEDRELRSRMLACIEAGGDRARLLTVLADAIEAVEDPAERREHVLRAAREEIAQNEPALALERYRELLVLDPSDEVVISGLWVLARKPDVSDDACDLLRDHFEAQGAPDRARQVVEFCLGLPSSEGDTASARERRLRFLREGARLSSASQDDSAAYDYLERILKDSKQDGIEPEELERFVASANRLGKREEASARLWELASANERDMDARLLLQTSAQLEEGSQSDAGVRRAIRNWEAIRVREPDDQEALLQLERLSERAGDDNRLLAVLQSRIEGEADADARRKMHWKRIGLLKRGADATPAIVQSLEAILEEDFVEEAARELAPLYEGLGQTGNLLELYERELASPGLSRAKQLAVHEKIGTLCERDGGDPERALDAYEAAFELDPANKGLLASFERLLSRSETALRASLALEKVYVAHTNWPGLLKCLMVRFEHEGSPDERRRLLLRIAKAQEEQLEDFRAALLTKILLFRENVEDQGLVAELLRLARVSGETKLVAEVLSEELAKIDVDTKESSELARIAGDLFLQTGNDEAALALVLRHYRFLPSEHGFSLGRAKEILGRQGAADANKREVLFDLNAESLEFLENDQDRIRTHLEMALLARTLGRKDDVVAHYEEARALDESDAGVTSALLAAYLDNDQVDRYLGLREAIAALTPDRKVAAEHRIAIGRACVTRGLVNSDGADLERAAGEFALVTELARAGEDPAWVDAANALEALSRDQFESFPDAAHAADAALDRAFEKAGMVHDRLRTLERMMARAPVETRLTVAEDVVRLADQLKSYPVMFGTAKELFLSDPENNDFARAMIRASLLGQLHGELDAFLATESARELARHDASEATSLTVTRVRALVLAAPRQGITVAGEVILDAWLDLARRGDAEASELAERQAKLLGAELKMAEALRLRSSLEADPALRCALLKELGALYTDLSERGLGFSKEEARACFVEALDADVGDRDALGWLYEDATTRGEGRSAIDYAEQLLELGQEPAEECLWLRRIAEHYRDIGENGVAIGYAERAYQRNPRADAVADLLIGLCKQGDDNEKLAEVLRQELAATPEVDNYRALALELADLSAGALATPAEALPWYRAALTRVALDEKALFEQWSDRLLATVAASAKAESLTLAELVPYTSLVETQATARGDLARVGVALRVALAIVPSQNLEELASSDCEIALGIRTRMLAYYTGRVFAGAADARRALDSALVLFTHRKLDLKELAEFGQGARSAAPATPEPNVLGEPETRPNHDVLTNEVLTDRYVAALVERSEKDEDPVWLLYAADYAATAERRSEAASLATRAADRYREQDSSDEIIALGRAEAYGGTHEWPPMRLLERLAAVTSDPDGKAAVYVKMARQTLKEEPESGDDHWSPARARAHEMLQQALSSKPGQSEAEAKVLELWEEALPRTRASRLQPPPSMRWQGLLLDSYLGSDRPFEGRTLLERKLTLAQDEDEARLFAYELADYLEYSLQDASGAARVIAARVELGDVASIARLCESRYGVENPLFVDEALLRGARLEKTRTMANALLGRTRSDSARVELTRSALEVSALHLEAVLVVDGSSPSILQTDAERAEQKASLLQVYEERTTLAASDGERAEWLSRQLPWLSEDSANFARVEQECAELLGRTDQARAIVFLEAVCKREEPVWALTKLVALLRAAGRQDRLPWVTRLLASDAAKLSADEKVSLHREAAELHRQNAEVEADEGSRRASHKAALDHLVTILELDAAAAFVGDDAEALLPLVYDKAEERAAKRIAILQHRLRGGTPGVRVRLAESHLELDHREEAQALLASVEAHEENYARALELEASLHRKASRDRELAATLRKLRERTAASETRAIEAELGSIHFGLYQRASEHADLEEARRAWEAAVMLGDESYHVRCGLYDACMIAAAFDEALSRARELQAFATSTETALARAMRVAECHDARQEPALALSTLTALLAARKESPEVLPFDDLTELRVAILRRATELGDAKRRAEVLADEASDMNDPALASARYMEAAQALAELPDALEERLRYLQLAAEKQPTKKELQLEVVDMLIPLGRLDEAGVALENAIAAFGTKRSRELATYQERLARVRGAQGDKAQALTLLDSAFRSDPGNLQVLRQLASLSFDTGDYDRAQKTFRALLLQKLSPAEKAETFFGLGQVLVASGEGPKAKQMFERAIENDGTHQRARDELTKLRG